MTRDEPGQTGDARGAGRSPYHHQVRAIAPDTLADRETDLADLAAFCAGDGDYLLLLADPWAGKTALLSWFALNPPPGVRVVSFFVTGRLAAHSDRDAFLAVAVGQLASMLDEPVPTPPAGTHLSRLLDAAAAACVARGQRLVLVVDGIDEDTGAHSIAALLPASPPPGMRVIVTGRHHPPVPSDVPAAHPLRDRAVARVLAASPHARDVRREAEHELTRLLAGTDVERDVLGLVAAAGGGLSGEDLAVLTGRRLPAIEESLHSAAGRAFTRLPAPDSDVYVLGHQELQSAATRLLGDEPLAGYRQRLHDWAGEYRRADWPEDTPGYLLGGYFRMLRAAGDRTGMTACALDPARHDRMLAVSGTDTAALAEIAAAQDALHAADTVDLRSMALLAVRHDVVVERDRHLPAGLSAVLALLGHQVRARALARAIADPGTRVQALVALGDALGEQPPGAVRAGDVIGDVIGEAAAVARAITPSMERDDALSSVARAAARAGNLDQAVGLVRDMADQRRHSLTLTGVADAGARAGDTRGAAAVAAAVADPRGRFSAQRAVARAAAEAGDLGFGVALARGIDNPDRRADVLRDVAEAAARGGHVDGAEVVARDIADAKRRMWTLGAIATTVAANGNLVTAAELASAAAAEAAASEATASRAWVYAAAANRWRGEFDAAIDFAGMIVFPEERAEELVELAAAMTRAGDLDRATAVVADAATTARAVDRTGRRARTLVGVAKAAALAGDTGQAHRLAGEAWTLAMATDKDDWDRRVAAAELVALPGDTPDLLLCTISDPRERNRVSAEAAELSARAGDLDRAEGLARTITDAELRARTCTGLAREAVRAGLLDRAAALAGTAETTARTQTLSRRWALALADAADSVTHAGDPGRARELATAAETFARTTVDPRWRAQGLAKAAVALARSGARERAMDIVVDVEALTETFADQQDRQWVRATVAKALAHAGKPERALAVAYGITNRLNRAPVLYEIIAAVARTGDLGHARGLVLAITDPYDQQRATAAAARAAALAGHIEHATVLAGDAEAMAQDGDVDSWRATTLAAAATAAAQAGNTDYARRLVRDAAAAARALPVDRRTDRARSLAQVAQAAAHTGDLAHAANIAREAEADLRSSSDSAGRSPAMQEILTTALLTGDEEHADALARDLPPHALGRAAAHAARFVAAHQARPLLAKALRHNDWRDSVDAIAVVEPAVLTEIAQLLLTGTTGR